MPEGEESHSTESVSGASPEARSGTRSPIGPLAAIVIVIEVLVAAALAGSSRLDTTPTAPAPAPVVFPALAALPTAEPSPTPGAPGPAAIRACLTPVLADPMFGPRLAVAVTGVTGRQVVASGPEVVTPASTIKLFTGAAALGVVGPTQRFSTTVRISDDGRTLALVGGGDALLARTASSALVPGAATLKDLAQRTAEALSGRPRHGLRLVVDDSLFSGPAVNPAWEPSYVPDGVVSPISALWVDEGHVRPGGLARAQDPAAAAGRVFAGFLHKQGIPVRTAGHASTSRGFTEIAAVEGPSLLDTVRHVLDVSDNEGAEVLARQVALGLGEPATFAGARVAVGRYLAGIGVPTSGLRYLDGSGLSRQDRVPVATYLALMRAAVADPVIRPLLTDLPVSGFSGTLGYRYDDVPLVGHGTVHGKTGTLTGVHSLVGYAVTPDGAPLLFVAVADRVPTIDTVAARDGLALLTSALAGCAA